MVAIRLARSLDQGMSAAVARELRASLETLALDGDEDDGHTLAVLRALRELAR